MNRPRILLADDHVLLMDAFRKLLEPEFVIIGAVCDGHSLLTAAAKLEPDLIIVDLALPLLNGMDAGRKLIEMLPRTKLLVVTMNEDAAIATRALEEWASGYLLKKSAGSELIHAIRELMAGRTYVTSRITYQMEREFMRNPTAKTDKSLTQRQREVLQLLAEGLTMKETADTLKLTTRTVAFHKYKIMEDFGLHNNLDLLRLAIKEHLVSAK
jgi:DNA-binding NarL/FixJ family response regulator